MHALYRSHLSAHGVPDRELPKPLRVPRPGSAHGADPAARPRATSPEQVTAVIEAAWGAARV